MIYNAIIKFHMENGYNKNKNPYYDYFEMKAFSLEGIYEELSDFEAKKEDSIYYRVIDKVIIVGE